MEIDQVTIESSDSHAKLTFSDFCLRDRQWYVGDFDVTIEDAGLRSTVRAGLGSRGAFPGFFDGVARDWRGWEGKRVAESRIGELHIEGTTDGLGHVFLHVRLRSWNEGPGRPLNVYTWDMLNWLWGVEARLRLDAGQLDEIAWNVRRFFDDPVPPREQDVSE